METLKLQDIYVTVNFLNVRCLLSESGRNSLFEETAPKWNWKKSWNQFLKNCARIEHNPCKRTAATVYLYHIQHVEAQLPTNSSLKVNFVHGWSLFITKFNYFDNNDVRKINHITKEIIIFKNSFPSISGCNCLYDLYGPHFLPRSFIGKNCQKLFEHVLPETLDEVPLMEKYHLWYIHDGAPPHFSLIAGSCRIKITIIVGEQSRSKLW